MTMLEKKVVTPENPKFYKRYVDDIINRRKKNEPDHLLEKIRNFHPNIKFTVEVNPEKFLDTKLLYEDGQCITRVFRKPNKVPLHWFSKHQLGTNAMLLLATFIGQNVYPVI